MFLGGWLFTTGCEAQPAKVERPAKAGKKIPPQGREVEPGEIGKAHV